MAGVFLLAFEVVRKGQGKVFYGSLPDMFGRFLLFS